MDETVGGLKALKLVYSNDSFYRLREVNLPTAIKPLSSFWFVEITRPNFFNFSSRNTIESNLQKETTGI